MPPRRNVGHATSPRPRLPPSPHYSRVLRGSFSGIRQQRSGIAEDQQLGRRSDGRYVRRTASSSAATVAASSAIPVANKAAERRKGTKAEEEKGANAAFETATVLRRRNRCSLQRAANVQKRKSERRLPIYLFYLVFLQWPYRITGEFQGQLLEVEVDEWGSFKYN